MAAAVPNQLPLVALRDCTFSYVDLKTHAHLCVGETLICKQCGSPMQAHEARSSARQSDAELLNSFAQSPLIVDHFNDTIAKTALAIFGVKEALDAEPDLGRSGDFSRLLSTSVIAAGAAALKLSKVLSALADPDALVTIVAPIAPAEGPALAAGPAPAAAPDVIHPPAVPGALVRVRVSLAQVAGAVRVRAQDVAVSGTAMGGAAVQQVADVTIAQLVNSAAIDLLYAIGFAGVRAIATQNSVQHKKDDKGNPIATHKEEIFHFNRIKKSWMPISQHINAELIHKYTSSYVSADGRSPAPLKTDLAAELLSSPVLRIGMATAAAGGAVPRVESVAISVFDEYIRKAKSDAKRENEALKLQGIMPPTTAPAAGPRLHSYSAPAGRSASAGHPNGASPSGPPHSATSTSWTSAQVRTRPPSLPQPSLPRPPPNPADVAAAAAKSPAVRNKRDCLLLRACFKCKEASFLCASGRNPCQRQPVGIDPNDPSF
jgi:hypothetical protein